MRRWSLLRRLLVSHLLIALAGSLISGIWLDRVLEHRLTRDLETRLAAQAREIDAAISLTPKGTDLQAYVVALGSASGTRITVIGTDGVVIADSVTDPKTMGSHAGRPEVVQALQGRVGSNERLSQTVREPFLYVAIPPHDGRLVRLALSDEIVVGDRREVRRILAFAFLAVSALAAFLATAASRSFARPLSEIARAVSTPPGGKIAPVVESGPAEAREVARAVNRMAHEVASRIDQLGQETELREQILSSMVEGVILAESSGVVVYANPAAIAFLGPTPNLPAQLAEPGTHELTVHHPRRRDLRVVIIRPDIGRTLVVLEDITETSRLEAMRRDFVADASHELKTPVAAILATAETLQTAMVDDAPSADRFVASLVADARRLGELVTDLLDLARFEMGPTTGTRVSLSDVVLAECNNTRPVAEQHGLVLDVHVDPDVFADGNQDDFGLMVRNLLDNAIRYTERGSVSVELSTIDGHADLQIADTGAGIPAKDLPRIFERFYRVDKARSRATGGTGLGLAIVRHVVESAGGVVQANSELGVGSRFVVSLPLSTR